MIIILTDLDGHSILVNLSNVTHMKEKFVPSDEYSPPTIFDGTCIYIDGGDPIWVKERLVQIQEKIISGGK